ncbi:hypothetical protein AMTR_s00027p00234720 [Amborella trichopoda]|uniref:GST C-terminal domain-containing protein n=1 Tax=Amborella trichopoda TaxID=13333 RepID=W1PSY8_AMBTC|nr:hypothetical protein AMTR_s00027p00234720 [Amborella trichopoda]
MPVLEESAGFKVFDPEKLPRLRSWTEEFTKVQVVKEAFPPRDKLLAAFKAYHDQIAEGALAQTLPMTLSRLGRVPQPLTNPGQVEWHMTRPML